uniref:Putative effector protein n=1 Tax=Heterodera avenae TaxID=34510 RepID=A0A2L0VDM9_HETAV|nr:putative effector protein [Heterodera avenae]
MHVQTVFLHLFVPLFVASIVWADILKDEPPRDTKNMPITRTRRSLYKAMMEDIGITKEATRFACRVLRTKFCTKFGTTLGMERTRRDTKADTNTKADTKMETKADTKMDTKADTRTDMVADTKAAATKMDTKADTKTDMVFDTKAATKMDTRAEAKADTQMDTKADTNNVQAMMDSIVPSNVATLLDRTTKELHEATQRQGFHELSQAEQERVMLEAAGKQGDIVKTKLKEAIEEARKMVERAIGTMVSYSEMPIESKLAMERVFMTLTDVTKTPTQKVERIREIERDWTPEIREALNPCTEDKQILEAARYYTDTAQQIGLANN